MRQKVRQKVVFGIVLALLGTSGGLMAQGAPAPPPPRLAAGPLFRPAVQSLPAVTHVCGRLSTDTTWNLAGSPYELDCTVGVPSGVTLTIQPGVVVLGADGTALQVKGILHAEGTTTNPIPFAACESPPTSFLTPTPTPQASGATCDGRWVGIWFVGGADPTSTISYATIADASSGIGNYPGSQLDHLTLVHNGTGIVLEGCCSSRPQQVLISNSTIETNGTGIDLFSVTLTVENTTIANNQYSGISAGSGSVVVSAANIVANRTGIYLFSCCGSLTVTGSVISENTIGIEDDAVSSNTHHLTGNRITDNQRFAIEVTGDPNLTVDATGNWWGTTDATAIQQMIHDCFFDLTRPCVLFQPFLAGPPCGAPTPVPTPSPIASPVSTGTPTQTVSPTPTTTVPPCAPPLPTLTPSPTSTPTPTPTPSSTPTPLSTPPPIGPHTARWQADKRLVVQVTIPAGYNCIPRAATVQLHLYVACVVDTVPLHFSPAALNYLWQEPDGRWYLADDFEDIRPPLSLEVNWHDGQLQLLALASNTVLSHDLVVRYSAVANASG